MNSDETSNPQRFINEIVDAIILKYDEMNEYFEGKKLYGDDFSFEQIKKWYDEEAEGYADLGSKNKNSYTYGYHIMNQIHGYDKIKKLNFENVLGFGSAWGSEFEPISKKIGNLTIIEPSDSLVNNKIDDLIPRYVKPNINGSLPFNDNLFDLITCFGTLHHIPNVSYVISELIRVFKTRWIFTVKRTNHFNERLEKTKKRINKK